MCGISLIFKENIKEQKIIQNLINKIKHRGPDDEGYFFSNHRAFTKVSPNNIDPWYGKGQESQIRFLLPELPFVNQFLENFFLRVFFERNF